MWDHRSTSLGLLLSLTPSTAPGGPGLRIIDQPAWVFVATDSQHCAGRPEVDARRDVDAEAQCDAGAAEAGAWRNVDADAQQVQASCRLTAA